MALHVAAMVSKKYETGMRVRTNPGWAQGVLGGGGLRGGNCFHEGRALDARRPSMWMSILSVHGAKHDANHACGHLQREERHRNASGILRIRFVRRVAK
jgi:hypothetical protein